MVHKDHVALLESGVTKNNGVWADLGSGAGAFTLALRDLAGKDSTIFSIDQNTHSLQKQKEAFAEMFPQSKVHFITQDFTQPLNVPKLDGIIMANSLHYVEQQEAFLKSIKKYLQPNGKLLLIEYNAEVGNQWVPYPISFNRSVLLAKAAGYTAPKLLGTIPSNFLHEIYSVQMHAA